MTHSAISRLRRVRISAWMQTLLAALGVLLVQLWLLYPSHRTQDLPVWDELNFYALPGLLLSEGSGRLQSIEYGPLYSLLYAPLIAGFGLVPSILAMRYVMAGLVVLALFALLLTTLRSLRAAMALALVWTLTPASLLITTPVYHLGLALLCLALAISRQSRLAAWLWIVLAGFVRPEYFFLAGAYALVWGGSATLSFIRRRSPQGWPRRPTWPLAILVVAQLSLLGLLLSLVSSFRFSAGRSWLAFQQHYAFAQVIEGRYSLDPWADFAYIIARELPEATSVATVLRLYPELAARHIGANLLAAPRSALDLLLPVAVLRPGAIWLGGVAVLLLAVALGRGQRTPFWATVRALGRGAGDLPWLALVVPLTLVPNLLVNLRFVQYLLVLAPFLFFAVGSLGLAALRVGQQTLNPQRTVWVATIRRWLVPSFALLLLVLVGVQAGPYAEPSERVVAAKVDQLAPLLPPAPFVTYGSTIPSYLGYLCASCQAAYPLSQGRSVDLAADLARYQPAVVGVDAGLLTSPFFDPTQLALLTAPMWHAHSIQDEVVYLAAAASDLPNEALVLLLPRNWRVWYHARLIDHRQDRSVLNLPGSFWIYTAAPRQVQLRLTPLEALEGLGPVVTPARIHVWLNGEPSAAFPLVDGQESTLNVSLEAGYNQLWFDGTDRLDRGEGNGFIPITEAIQPTQPALRPLRLLAVETLP